MKVIGIDPAFNNTAIVLIDTKKEKHFVAYDEFSPKEFVDKKIRKDNPDFNKKQVKDLSTTKKDLKIDLLTGFIISFIKKNADKDTIIVLEDLRQFSSIQTFVTGGLITTINKFLVKEYKLDLFHEKQLHYFVPNEWQRILGLVNGTQKEALKKKSLAEFHRFTNMNIITSDDVSDAYNIARFYVHVKSGKMTTFSEKRKQNKREEIQRQKQKERENNKYVLIYQPNYESMSKKALANIVLIAQENLKSYMEFYKMEGINKNVDEKFILDILKTEKKEKLMAFINEKVESGYYYSIKNQAKRTFSIEQALQVPRYKLENVIIEEKLDKNFWKKKKVEQGE